MRSSPEKCRISQHFLLSTITTCLMYNFYHHVHTVSPRRRLVMQWRVRERSYNALHLKHCILTIVAISTANIDIECTHFKQHPYFSDEAWMSGFIDRFRTYSAHDTNMDRVLEKEKKVVFKENFILNLERPVQRLVQRSLQRTIDGPVGITFMHLWLTVRNRKHHRDQDRDDTARFMMGTIPIENFCYWAKKFPYFYLYLFLNIAKYKPAGEDSVRMCSNEEFKYFFPAPKVFYGYCCSVPLVDPEPF